MTTRHHRMFFTRFILIDGVTPLVAINNQGRTRTALKFTVGL